MEGWDTRTRPTGSTAGGGPSGTVDGESMPSEGLVGEVQVMRQDEPGRRVERARQLLQAGTDLSLAEVALRAGFSDQSQFSQHFKHLVGITPGQFRTHARTA